MAIADVQVSEEDGLPNVICPSCFAQLELSHQFKLQVEKADTILREEISLNAILPIKSEVVEYNDEMVKCENVQTENAEIDTNCAFQEEINATMCSLENERIGNKEGMNLGEAEKKHKNDTAGEPLNIHNEEKINTRLSCESEANIPYKGVLNSGATCYNNSVQKETSSKKLKFKCHHRKYNAVYKCQLCDASFKLKHLLNFHRLAYHGNHNSKKCDKVFPSRPEMENHHGIHLNECQLPVTCTTCEKVYTSKKYLNFHIKRQHSDYLPVACTTCGKVYKNKEGLQLHIRKQHTDNVRPYMCEICGVRCTDLTTLWSHKFTHNKQPITCEVCNKTYPHDRALKVHKRSVHLVSKRIHCDICGKDFKSRIILKRHKKIHTGERPYVCKICGFASAWNTAVRTHMKVHTGLESYSCEHCGQGFNWKQTFEKHVLKCFEKLHIFKTKNETSSTPENLNTAD